MTRSTNPAPPLRRLLVGTDFSPGATRALTRVPHLPLGTGATVTLMHVLPAWMNRAVHARDFGRVERRLRGEATRLLRALREAGRKQLRVATVLVQGNAPAEILRRSAAADLVLVGRHGRRSFRDLLVGSTAERVVQRATVPTLVVARRARTPLPSAAGGAGPVGRITTDTGWHRPRPGSVGSLTGRRPCLPPRPRAGPSPGRRQGRQCGLRP